MPTFTRSGRTVKNASQAQSKLDALELLARQRRGEKVEIAVKEDEPLFEEVNEDDHKRTRKGGFVVDAESDDDYDSDLSFIDDENDGPATGGGSGRGKKGPKGSSKKLKTIEPDPKQKSVRQFLSASASLPKFAPQVSQASKPPVNEDDILSQMLYDVPTSRTSSAQKPVRIATAKPSPVVTPRLQQSSSISRTPKTKAIHDDHTTTPKRPRMDRGSPARDRPSADTLYDDAFVDNSSVDWDPMPAATKEPPSIPMATDTALLGSIDDDDENSIDIGIQGVPLNDDLKSNLEFCKLDDGRPYTRMYWCDCVEDQNKSPGVVYFFGRIFIPTVKRFVSCCTIVKNVQRTIYLLIAPDSNYDQAVGEFTHITAKRLKIRNFTCSKATKKNSFADEPGVPLVADYVRVDYPASQPAPPAQLKGECFSRVFNVNQTPMEKLILELKLRGPCWFRLVDPIAPTSQLTWTRIELIIENPQNLYVDENTSSLQAPYFCTFSLSLRTNSNPITHQNEIIAIAGMVNTCFNLDQCLKSTNKASGHFLLMTKPAPAHKELKLPYDFQSVVKKYNKTRFELFDTERDLLSAFMDKFSNLDPDIVVGHDILNFDFETLVMRMKNFKLGVWSKLGRFKRSELPSTKAAFRYMFSGRIICDIRTSAMELIRLRSYDLTELALQVLKRQRTDYSHQLVVEAFKSSQSLVRMLDATREDNDSIFSILVELNVIPLALKITNITGNILSRTLAAGRSERNEYLLLHAFHDDNFICPEKQVHKFQRRGAPAAGGANGGGGGEEALQPVRKKAAYAGGLVLEPKAGYYDTCVLLMDFNSLYPSIIQEFNICFSTVKRPEVAAKQLAGAGLDPNAELVADVPDDSVPTGILPSQLRQLVDRRRQVKKLLADSKSEDQKMMLDIEQKALKLTANSMYGCLGFEQSRFYAKHLASLVTFKGREILMNTKAMVEKLGYEVIYGDTDSLMINTKLADYDEVIQRGTAIKAEINRTFKLLEIDIDGVFKPLLLLKKKNYAGAAIKKLADGQLARTIETKGLDTVRRDRAVVAKEAGERVLAMILGGGKEIDQIVEDIHNYLKELGQQIANNEVPKEKFLISKQLNRNPEEYRDTKGIGHVACALRFNQDPKRSRKMRSGDTVDYVVCADGTTESANQRAYTLEELAEKPETLKLDHEYYLCQQIHPVMTRICDKLPVTNAYVLAEMLGVERSSMLHIKREDTSDTNAKRDQLLSRGEARFNSCKPLVITCPNCKLPAEIGTRTRRNKTTKRLEFSLSSCEQCNYRYAHQSGTIVVQIILQIKRLTTELYNCKWFCENTDCDYETRNVFGPIVCLTGSGSAVASGLASDDGGPAGAAERMQVALPGAGGGGADDVSTGGGGGAAGAARAAPMCEYCLGPMVPELDDRKVDLQLSFYKFLLDANRETALLATSSTPVGRLEAASAPAPPSNSRKADDGEGELDGEAEGSKGTTQQQQLAVATTATTTATATSTAPSANVATADLLDLYSKCFREVNYALRTSATYNIETLEMFSMISSGRQPVAVGVTPQ